MKLRAIVSRMLLMQPEAWYIFRRSLQLGCLLLFCAFVLLLGWGGQNMTRYRLYMTAQALNEITQAVLLIGVLLSVILEDVLVNRR